VRLQPNTYRRRPWFPRLAGVALATLTACGCAGFWDEVTSRNRDLKGYFFPPDPKEVLQKSSDGAKRGKALMDLKEPLTHGGTQEQEESYLKLLTRSALADNDPQVRLGAIRALGKCKNPSAVHILEDVFQQPLPFAADVNSIVRQQALASLEQTGLPEARHWLIRVARQPQGAGSYNDQQQVLDERLTALRGLSRFKQSDSTETLVYVLQTEKDVALRDRACQSLRIITGKHLPPDAAAWAALLHDPNTNLGREPNMIQRATNWVDDLLH
jgi:HEAT repeat protein